MLSHRMPRARLTIRTIPQSSTNNHLPLTSTCCPIETSLRLPISQCGITFIRSKLSLNTTCCNNRALRDERKGSEAKQSKERHCHPITRNREPEQNLREVEIYPHPVCIPDALSFIFPKAFAVLCSMTDNVNTGPISATSLSLPCVALLRGCMPVSSLL